MDRNERFVFNKLITGGFRIGVSQSMIVNALSRTYELEAAVVSHMISGNWDPQQITLPLVPFAKAYSGLTDKEIAEVDNWVKRNAVEKFGPVRTVKPELVFEIAFEGIAASNRHKSGIALRFPRIHRWRQDKPVSEINTLDDLKELLRLQGGA